MDLKDVFVNCKKKKKMYVIELNMLYMFSKLHTEDHENSMTVPKRRGSMKTGRYAHITSRLHFLHVTM